MITLYIRYPNRTEYNPLSSLWAANLIAINTMRNDPRITHIDIVNNDTGEVYRTYTRG